MQNDKNVKIESSNELPSRLIYSRLPLYLINRVKVEANKLGISYKSLMVQYIAAGVAKKKR